MTTRIFVRRNPLSDIAKQGSEKFTATITESGEMRVECLICGDDAEVEYRGQSSGFPKFRLSCTICNRLIDVTLYNQNAGFPSKV
jgi:hypothetical protein